MSDQVPEAGAHPAPQPPQPSATSLMRRDRGVERCVERKRERERERQNLGLGRISLRFMLVCCHLAMYELMCPCMQVQLVACACTRFASK